MTSRSQIESTIRNAYVARVAGDLDNLMAYFTPDAVFEINGRGTGAAALSAPTTGVAAIRTTMSALIQMYRFENWREVSLLVDGEKAALHWTANVIDTQTGKSGFFDVFDFFTIRDGRIAKLHQTFDTALAMSLQVASSSAPG